MRDERLQKTKRILLRALGLVIFGFVGLAMLWISHISVGYLNMAASYWSLKPIATLAMTYPLEPGQSVKVEHEDGALIAERFGRITIIQADDEVRVVTFDRGGGHLGTQGYIYAPSATDSHLTQKGAPGASESIEISALFGDWYTYDSREE